MKETENTGTTPTSSSQSTSFNTAKPASNNESNGTTVSLYGHQHKFSSIGTNESAGQKSTTGDRSSSTESIEAMDPMVLRRAQSEDGALELPALKGTDLASFALTRSHSKLSLSDLNIIGMALLKDAVAQDRPDHKAAASVFSVMANMNSKAAGPKKTGPTDRVRIALEKAASAIEAERKRQRTIVDITPEGDDE
jgi:hypothetical protein